MATTVSVTIDNQLSSGNSADASAFELGVYGRCLTAGTVFVDFENVPSKTADANNGGLYTDTKTPGPEAVGAVKGVAVYKIPGANTCLVIYFCTVPVERKVGVMLLDAAEGTPVDRDLVQRASYKAQTSVNGDNMTIGRKSYLYTFEANINRWADGKSFKVSVLGTCYSG